MTIRWMAAAEAVVMTVRLGAPALCSLCAALAVGPPGERL